ncbi:MAG: hypothetical protein M5R36_17265 [Deltaproteobacteria bacterium]|nr:hypothetical protein [Deltaproteobacteria bacterium]
MTAHNTEQLRHAAAVLEWPKVLARLGEFASSEPGRDACLELSFQETPEGARRACRRTAEAAVFAREGQFAPLADLTRLDRELGRLRAGGTLTAEELRRTALVYQASRLVRTLILDRWEDVPVLAELGAALIEDLGLEREILGAIDEEGHVADQASPELAKLRARYRDIHKRIYETMQKLVTRSEFVDHLQDDFFTLRGGRYVLVVKIEKQGKVEGIVHDISGSGQSLFIEPREITQLNNVLRNTEPRHRPRNPAHPGGVFAPGRGSSRRFGARGGRAG